MGDLVSRVLVDDALGLAQVVGLGRRLPPVDQVP